jgi:hypothetical protein
MLKKLFLLTSFLLIATGIFILSADVPQYRAERIFFGSIGLNSLTHNSPTFDFIFEKPSALKDLKESNNLDLITADRPSTDRSDFEKWIALMHWTRDQFPHAKPIHEPSAQSFDGFKLLKNKTSEAGFLCGTASQLLIQAITSMGGYARRVELRYKPDDKHAVAEVWSDFYNKWIVVDADYDIFYTRNNIPLNALELHNAWANQEIDSVEVHWRESINNIYKPEDHEFRFTKKLLNYYSHISYPLRNDWKSRPLPWWHSEGNYVQNSLVIDLPTMTKYEDFLVKTKDFRDFYAKP